MFNDELKALTLELRTAHRELVLRILRYLSAKPDFKISYKKINHLDKRGLWPVGFCTYLDDTIKYKNLKCVLDINFSAVFDGDSIPNKDLDDMFNDYNNYVSLSLPSLAVYEKMNQRINTKWVGFDAMTSKSLEDLYEQFLVQVRRREMMVKANKPLMAKIKADRQKGIT